MKFLSGQKLYPRFREEAIPDELIEIQCAGRDPFIQANAQFQRTRLIAPEVYTVWALRVLAAVLETGRIPAVTSGLEIGRGHHLLFQLAQRRISHEIACHKVMFIPSCLISPLSSLISAFSSMSFF